MYIHCKKMGPKHVPISLWKPKKEFGLGTSLEVHFGFTISLSHFASKQIRPPYLWTILLFQKLHSFKPTFSRHNWWIWELSINNSLVTSIFYIIQIIIQFKNKTLQYVINLYIALWLCILWLDLCILNMITCHVFVSNIWHK
jgi:hypothetical protein